MVEHSADPTAKATILDHWRSYRDADQLGTLLPRSTPRTWGEAADTAAIVTVDDRIYRDLSLPASVADLVEVYWTVRLKGEVPDPNWATAINAHVIRVSTEPLGAEDLDLVRRQVVMIRRALHLGGIGGLIADCKPIALHVRGLVLGPDLSAPVAILERLASLTDVPLTVGRYRVADDGTVSFLSGSADTTPWEQGAENAEELTSLGQRLLRHDALMRTQGTWPLEAPPKEPKYGSARPEL